MAYVFFTMATTYVIENLFELALDWVGFSEMGITEGSIAMERGL